MKKHILLRRIYFGTILLFLFAIGIASAAFNERAVEWNKQNRADFQASLVEKEVPLPSFTHLVVEGCSNLNIFSSAETGLLKMSGSSENDFKSMTYRLENDTLYLTGTLRNDRPVLELPSSCSSIELVNSKVYFPKFIRSSLSVQQKKSKLYFQNDCRIDSLVMQLREQSEMKAWGKFRGKKLDLTLNSSNISAFGKSQFDQVRVDLKNRSNLRLSASNDLNIKTDESSHYSIN